MKPIFIASLTAALVAGFVGAATAVALGGREHTAAAQREAAVQRDNAEAAAARVQEASVAALSTNDSGALRDQIAVLANEVDSLRQELDVLRDGLARQATPSAVETAPVGVDQLASVQRDAVVQILQEERDKEQAKRDEERKQREQQAIAERAAKIAKELGLGAADERKLTDFMGVASTKRDEMFRGVRDGNFDRDTMRKNFDDYRTWAETELNSTFGANLGAQILQSYRDQRDFGGGFGGGSPWQGQPGQGQGQSGGSSQRQGRGQ